MVGVKPKLFNPFRAAVSFWGQLGASYLELESDIYFLETAAPKRGSRPVASVFPRYGRNGKTLSTYDVYSSGRRKNDPVLVPSAVGNGSPKIFFFAF